MSFPASIRPQVGQSLITRVSRLFNGTIADVLNELLQNARRAGATAIDIELANLAGKPTLIFADDGVGIDNPANLLTLGQSGWNADLAAREDPAGMGVFSLAGRHVMVRSWSRSAGHGWQVTIPEGGWEGQIPLDVEPADIVTGTQFFIALPESWVERLTDAVKVASRYFPLPVCFRGVRMERADFLHDACRVEEWHGCRIGVFRERRYQANAAHRINFHGVTVPCEQTAVQQIGDTDYEWAAKVDILDAPLLQLVLPARKEMVESPALADLRIAMETAIYRAIANQTEHRLAFKDWQRATKLGVTLPEAAAWLEAWRPRTADITQRWQDDSNRACRSDMMIVPTANADIEQAAAPVLTDIDMLHTKAVRGEPAFAGYGWYDRLPCVVAMDFHFEQDGRSWCYGDSATGPLPGGLTCGRVPSITLELAIIDSGNRELRSYPVQALVCSNECYSVEEAIILVAEGADVSPEFLANLMEDSLFWANDDYDSGSWEAQNDRFCREARDLANTLLLGSEAACLARLHEAIENHITWLIPKGRQLVLTATNDGLALSLDHAA